MSENKALEGLFEGVLARDLCTACGACSGLCPYLRSSGGRIVKLDACDRKEGRCFAYCPRTEVNLEEIHRKIFGEDYLDPELGAARGIFMARASDPAIRKRGQTGGAVSALLDVALKEGTADAAVLTRRNERHLPEGTLVRDRDALLACAGSSYVSGATLEALNQAKLKEGEKLALVGTPCQVLAFGKMRASDLERRTPIDQVSLVIGLFCTWALSHGSFMKFLSQRVDVSRIRKLDITPPPERLLKVITEGETLDIPIDDIRPFIRPACAVCPDMTAELADISVGTVEGEEGWNTVIVRSDRGEALAKMAREKGALEFRPYPEGKLAHLKEASLLKKKRALTALKERGEPKEAYLKLSPGLIRRILEEE